VNRMPQRLSVLLIVLYPATAPTLVFGHGKLRLEVDEAILQPR
jgi:hypothetical protein